MPLQRIGTSTSHSSVPELHNILFLGHVKVPETPSDHLMAGFLASLTESAHIDEEVVRLGPRLGTGGTADVFALEFLQDDHRRASKLYGNGRGFVCKKIKKVNVVNLRRSSNSYRYLRLTGDLLSNTFLT